jgi:2,3-dihydroxybiphenyl 1,2-dioxygenase
MSAELELAYLGVEVTDSDAFGTFLRDVAGLVPGQPTDAGDPTWRNDERAQRIIVSEGPRNDAVFVGLEATSLDAFASAVERARATGAKVTGGSPEVKSARGVDDLVSIAAPWGVPIEIVHGLASAAEAFHSQRVPEGFLTKGVGFGHVVFVTSNLDEADRFARDVLGLVQSDWLETDLGGLPLTVRFYHCNARHHTLAIGSLPIEMPQRLHHLMLEMLSLDSVGHAFDRAMNAGLTIANGLGRHENDKMFSFYVVTPAGFQLEIGYGARSIDEPWTDDRLYTQISEWGHQPVAPPLPA